MVPTRMNHFSLTRAIFLLIICIMSVKTMTGNFILDRHRQKEPSLINDDKFEFSLTGQKCLIPLAKPMDAHPVLIASYPGSGAKLTWKLIRAITGIMTSDDYDHNGLAKRKEVIGIKTHYPVPNVSNQQTFSSFAYINRSVLLLRNPIDALSSYHNFQYEMSNNLQNHSVRAPSEKWIEWRDKYFYEEMKAWVDHTKFWILHHAPENRLIISYEHLVSSRDGPSELLKLKNFVRVGNEPILTTDNVDIPCIWDTLVNGSIDEGTRMASLRKGVTSKGRPLTDNQLKAVKDELIGLRDLFPDQLALVLNEYIERASRSR